METIETLKQLIAELEDKLFEARKDDSSFDLGFADGLNSAIITIEIKIDDLQKESN